MANNIPMPFNDPVCDKYSNFKPESNGSLGWTLAPKQHHWSAGDSRMRQKLDNPLFSTDENYQVQINKRLLMYPELMELIVSSAAHELYGPALFMFRGIDALHHERRTGNQSNSILENWIIERQNEAVNNYHN